MTDTHTDAEYLDVALALLELSLEYIVYHQYQVGKNPDDIKAVIADIISDMYLYIEQDYFLDEKNRINYPSSIDTIKQFMLQYLPETYSQPQVNTNVQNSN